MRNQVEIGLDYDDWLSEAEGSFNQSSWTEVSGGDPEIQGEPVKNRYCFRKAKQNGGKMDLKEYRDRVSGCWLGKNIGGTLGMPMEWERKKNNVTYYTHDITGEPLPNDDLDIQILWLLALEEKGIDVDAKVLGEYFNEYMIFTHAE